MGLCSESVAVTNNNAAKNDDHCAAKEHRLSVKSGKFRESNIFCLVIIDSRCIPLK